MCSTSHLLLGLLNAGDGRARQVLEALGADLEALEREVRVALGPAMDPAQQEIEAGHLPKDQISEELQSVAVQARDCAGEGEGSRKESNAEREGLEAILGEAAGGKVPGRQGWGSAIVLLTLARSLALECGQKQIGTEHLLHTLAIASGLDDPFFDFDKVLPGFDPLFWVLASADPSARIMIIDAFQHTTTSMFSPVKLNGKETLSDNLWLALKKAAEEASAEGSEEVGPMYLLLGILRVEDCSACKPLAEFGMDPMALRNEVLRQLEERRAEQQEGAVDNTESATEEGPQQEATTVNLAELPLGVRTLFVAVGTKIWSGGLLRHLVAEWGVDLAAADAIYYEVQNETLLHVAARQGKADVVAALLDEGADMNKGDCKSGCIPLMTAAGEGHADVVKVLLEGGADITLADSEGSQAHHYATGAGEPETLKLLLQAGADVSARTNNGMTALHWAATCYEYEDRRWLLSVTYDLKSVVRLLAEAGADLNADCGGYSPSSRADSWAPLHIAADYDNVEAIEALAEVGADLERLDSKGRTPLFAAADYSNIEAARALLSAGANPAAQDYDGWTALHLAAYHGDGDFADVLLDAGTPLGVVDNAGRTAEEVALSHGLQQVHAFLRANRLGTQQNGEES